MRTPMILILAGLAGLCQPSDLKADVIPVTRPDGVVIFVNPTPDPAESIPTRVPSREPARRESQPAVQSRPVQPGSTVRIPFEWHGAGMVLRATVNERRTVKLLVDTGASSCGLSARVIQDLGYVNQDFHGPYGVIGASEVFLTVGATLESLELGSIREEKLDVLVMAFEIPGLDGFLGQNVLSNYRMEVDPTAEELILHPLGINQERYGGRSGITWCLRFQRLESSLDLWRSLRRPPGALRADEWNAKVEPMIDALQRQLSDLQVEAGRAGVPLEHRRGPCR